MTSRIRLSLLLLPFIAGSALAQSSISLDDVRPGFVAAGFKASALYLGNDGRPIGARFVHEPTGFLFDYLQIQSVPQTFLWVNSVPTSDMGEPHTQEHLLLGKGNKGRYVSSLEDMSVTTSSAFTSQWRTCYHSQTAAGGETFYNVFREQLDALLHPDYTDEEIRREVRNFGVDENAADGVLRLEEKGTVYNEMVSSYERAWSRMGRPLGQLVYGEKHPLSYESGGLPAAIREMEPSHIRKFHADNYRLGNMGMVASFPKEMPLGELLPRIGSILSSLEPGKPAPSRGVETIPPPSPAPIGTMFVGEYPSRNAQQPGPILMSWPASLSLDLEENLLIDFFVSNIAGDATTNLYKKLVDPKTRTIETGATGVFGWVSSDPGYPLYIGLSNVDPASMTKEKLGRVRSEILGEISRVAGLADNSPELVEFNRRIANRIVEARRSLSQFINTPPGFGYRGTGSGWMDHLMRLERAGTFTRPLALAPQLDKIEKMISSGTNVWRDAIKRWRLETLPYVAAARPSAELADKEERERVERNNAEVARLRKLYAASNDQEAIRRYRAEYDRETARLDSIARLVAVPRFVDNPPMTLDDQLDYRIDTVATWVPRVSSTFENMTGATTGIALRLDGARGRELVYLSILPSLLTDVGVIEKGRPVAYDVMRERLRTEVLSLDAYVSSSYVTGRCEIVVRGGGNDLTESKRAVEWMELALFNPDWRAQNLPRIREVVDQSLRSLRNTMQGSEESWVNDPAAAYWRQENPILLATESFMTRTHNLHRLRWLLKEPPSSEEANALAGFFARLMEEGKRSRSELKTMLASATSGSGTSTLLDEPAAPLSKSARAIALDALRDLEITLADIPDETLARDWRYLVEEMERDLRVPPSAILEEMDALRSRLLRARTARMFTIGSSTLQRELDKPLQALAGRLSTSPAPAAVSSTSTAPLVASRLKERFGSKPTFVGLVNPSTGSGVFLNSAPGPSYKDTDRESLLQFLSTMLYAGGGAHGIFMKTWGAGLAYSNGIRISPRSGRINYYAERCPALPQTLRFVIDEVKKAPIDTALVDYAVAQAFAEFRSASTYESRGESMASDLADGLTPDVVRRFRQSILDLRTTPGLAEELFKRMVASYGKVLPGAGVDVDNVPGGVYMVIGPEKQIAMYEDYLKTVEGSTAKVARIYPRDFWMTDEDMVR